MWRPRLGTKPIAGTFASHFAITRAAAQGEAGSSRRAGGAREVRP